MLYESGMLFYLVYQFSSLAVERSPGVSLTGVLSSLGVASADLVVDVVVVVPTAGQDGNLHVCGKISYLRMRTVTAAPSSRAVSISTSAPPTSQRDQVSQS